MSIPEGDAATIKFGDGLDVTDEGANVIRVDNTGMALIADMTIDALDSGGFPTGRPSEFDITDIPSTYSDLLGVLSIRWPPFDAIAGAYWRFNADSAANYYQRSPTDTEWDDVHYTLDGDSHFRTLTAGASSSPAQFSHHSFLIPGYASTDWHKTVEFRGIVLSTETDARLIFFHELVVGFWDSTAAINQISISPAGFVDGSRLRLYGRS